MNLVNTILVTALILMSPTLCIAEGSSKLGNDYLKITQNPLLADIMLEYEPKLIEYYRNSEYGHIKGLVEDGVSTVALNLTMDRINRSMVKEFRELAPDLPLKFLALDKKKYPNLWNFGELERLRKEKEDSLWLYRALHGKEYSEK